MYFNITNVDSRVDFTAVSCFVSNGNGESLWFEPESLNVYPMLAEIPPTNSYPNKKGPASRYPITIHVFGQPTNLNNVIVTLLGLSHARSSDLEVLLVGPSGKAVILMSHVGGASGVNGATSVFKQDSPAIPAPQSFPIPPHETSTYLPSNYGQVVLPQFGNDPPPPGNFYISDLSGFRGDNPNGNWKLYIYDDATGASGSLSGSWYINFDF